MLFVSKTFLKNFTLLNLFVVFFAVQASAFPNFDYDGKADFAVFRPSDKNWYVHGSELKEFSAINWGLASDRLVPADYDGDSITDCAVWRPETGTWFIRQSGNGQMLAINWGTKVQVPGGYAVDEPVPADFDGDGKIDIAVWRSATGVWFVLQSSNGYNPEQALIFHWGKLGDIPVPADYDGDGRTDFAVFRYTENRWYIFQSKTGAMRVSTFGSAGNDLLAPADYTGDGRADIAVFRSGVWYIERSEDGQMDYQYFGSGADTPVPADYDNDGETDFAVFSSGTWTMMESSTGQLKSFNFGQAGDIPIDSLNVKESIVGIP